MYVPMPSILTPIFIRKDKLLKRVDPLDIVCLETTKNYTKIFFTDATHIMVRSSLANAYKKLPSEIFIRISKSYVVSKYYIDNIESHSLSIPENVIVIGREYKQSVFKRLNAIE